MIKSKKAQESTTTMFFIIIGVVVFITLLIGGYNFAREIFSSYSQSQASIINFTNALDDVQANYSVPGTGKGVTIQLDEESAIIGFNPDADFNYIPKNKWTKGSYLKRLSQCEKGKTCVCLCEGYDIADNGIDITCKKINYCRNFDSFVLKKNMYMKDVFDDLDVRNINAESKRGNDYWLDSFIILRSSKISPDKYSCTVTQAIVILPLLNKVLGLKNAGCAKRDLRPVIISGFRDFLTLQFADVYVRRVGTNSNGKAVLDICFKKNCEYAPSN